MKIKERISVAAASHTVQRNLAQTMMAMDGWMHGWIVYFNHSKHFVRLVVRFCFLYTFHSVKMILKLKRPVCLNMYIMKPTLCLTHLDGMMPSASLLVEHPPNLFALLIFERPPVMISVSLSTSLVLLLWRCYCYCDCHRCWLRRTALNMLIILPA